MQKSSGRHESGGRGGPRKGDSDWLCPDTECANWNFAWRTSCNRCSGPKPPGEDAASSSNSKSKKLGHEIGKAMAEKSKGLFSADDWQCSKCGNVNWARRHQCNVCNAPRFGEVNVEERTGFGGGFNDRGVVEYKERKEESDDEWDEFGRRKKKSSGKSSSSDKNKRSHSSDEDKRSSNKKKRRDSTSSSSDSEVEKKKPKVESEDEDEDSGDEGDLSKYDLSGWGEDDDSKK